MPSADRSAHTYELTPASRFSTDELVDIYNAGRADYLVAMAMDAEALKTYVYTYDVDLDASVVVFDSQGQPAGIGLLGVRGDRGWITRLGIIPERRQGGMGMSIMQSLINVARQRQAHLIQLEVIQGNDAAHRLFQRCGFVETRRLAVVERPPVVLADDMLMDDVQVNPLSRNEIWDCLAQREPGESWVNENATLAKLAQLEGLRVISSETSGWIIYQRKESELGYVVLQGRNENREQTAAKLLHQLHHLYPEHKTRIENVPVGGLLQKTLQQFNYTEQFRRIEMHLNL